MITNIESIALEEEAKKDTPTTKPYTNTEWLAFDRGGEFKELQPDESPPRCRHEPNTTAQHRRGWI
jgi:hypothetical protein